MEAITDDKKKSYENERESNNNTNLKTLPTGTISMNDVRNELKISGSISLNQTQVRNLAGINSGRISLNDLKGKSDGPWFKNIVDYYFETRDDFTNRIEQIIAENNGELITKTFGFGDSVIDLYVGFCFSFDYPDGKKPVIHSTPKAIYSNNIENLTYCFYRSQIKKISPELFYNCKNIKKLYYTFSYSKIIEQIPNELFIQNNKIEDVTSCFCGCINITSKLPDVWNKEKFPNITTHYSYASYCEKAANFNEIPEGYK